MRSKNEVCANLGTVAPDLFIYTVGPSCLQNYRSSVIMWLHNGVFVGLVSLPIVLITAAIRNRRSNGSPKSNTTSNSGNKKNHNKRESNDDNTSFKLGIIGVLGIGSIGILLFGSVLIVLQPELLSGNFYLQHFIAPVSSNDATKACDMMLKSYKPTDLVGIYGDMKGQYHRDVDTSSALAAELFDQGMIHIYGFNQIEGIRNMRAALEVDKECAMCYWAIAQANGPNINTDVSEEMAKTGKTAIDQAHAIMTTKQQQQSKTSATDVEKQQGYLSDLNAALITSQRSRFSFPTIDVWKDHGQVVYDDKYAEAMRALTLLHAGTEHTLEFDPDVHAIYAEAVVNRSPWQYYISQLPLVERTEAMSIALENPIDPKGGGFILAHTLVHTYSHTHNFTHTRTLTYLLTYLHKITFSHIHSHIHSHTSYRRPQRHSRGTHPHHGTRLSSPCRRADKDQLPPSPSPASVDPRHGVRIDAR